MQQVSTQEAQTATILDMIRFPYPFDPSVANTLTITVDGAQISCAIDGEPLGTLTEPSDVATQSIAIGITPDILHYTALVSADLSNFSIR